MNRFRTEEPRKCEFLEAQAHFGRELQLQRGVFGLFHAISLNDELDWLLQGTAGSFLGIKKSMRKCVTAC